MTELSKQVRDIAISGSGEGTVVPEVFHNLIRTYSPIPIEILKEKATPASFAIR